MTSQRSVLFGMVLSLAYMNIHLPQAQARCSDKDKAAAQGLSNGFCLSAPTRNSASIQRRPNEYPPFKHWDLREFSGCVVPYSIHGELVRPTEEELAHYGQVDKAFQAWTVVSPAYIVFKREAAPQNAKCPFVLDKNNMVGWSDPLCGPTGNDQCIAKDATGTAVPCECGKKMASGTPIIGHGGDRFVVTSPQNCKLPNMDDRYDHTTRRIVDGGNGIIESQLNSGMWDETHTLAATVTIADASTGVIMESDILFNSFYKWAILGNNLQFPVTNGKTTTADVLTVALHEIGHFNGLNHVPGEPEIMRPAISKSDQTLKIGDRDGLNFLYTTDLGDAPDPKRAFNLYPTLVHGTTTRRTLNGVQLHEPALGAGHLFGIYDIAADGNRYQYEWLALNGGGIDDHVMECEARVVNRDRFDDGVAPLFLGALLFEPGVAERITVGVKTALDPEGMSHDYTARSMYINAWFDWDADGDWTDDNEHMIHESVTKAGEYTFDVRVPANVVGGGYARFRLDYGEDSQQISNIDDTLFRDKGAAQFGEVEDYPLHYVSSVVQLHVNGPLPNSVPVGSTASVQAKVAAADRAGVPNRTLEFVAVLGNLRFTNGAVSGDGRRTTLVSNLEGRARATFVPNAAGRALVRISVPGTSLSAYSYFSATQ